jgi:hypothetical protein
VLKRSLALTVVIMMLSGCAHDAEWLQRQDPVQSTIGNDASKAPAGKVIPPPGMGVDLGQRGSTGDRTFRA